MAGRVVCPLCKHPNPLVTMCYDSKMDGYRAVGTCLKCELKVTSDTFPLYSSAVKHLMEVWNEIVPDKKINK